MDVIHDLEWLERRFARLGYDCSRVGDCLAVRWPDQPVPVIRFSSSSEPYLSGPLELVSRAVAHIEDARVAYESAPADQGVVLPNEGPLGLRLGVKHSKIEGGWLVVPPEGWSWEKAYSSPAGARHYLIDEVGRDRATVRGIAWVTNPTMLNKTTGGNVESFVTYYEKVYRQAAQELGWSWLCYKDDCLIYTVDPAPGVRLELLTYTWQDPCDHEWQGPAKELEVYLRAVSVVLGRAFNPDSAACNAVE